ncbi:DUF2808 domain-containing protein [Leptolyngbya sp. PCC 6406]|uniref:DUF2808 domain-containing protein n=1 Tax=Leptolyngbya sp. PCC 6406 TaxID=1173264 RepID=UPI0002ACEA8B|nr:DUF2808 domain-containing protein [Leptolyngbya sp. PCC 6406]
MGSKSWLRNLTLSAIAVAGFGVVGGQTAIQATPALAQLTQTCQGLTLFGGVESEYRLGYCLDNNSRRNTRARYYLYVGGRTFTRDIIELQISYPEAFEEERGHFNNATIELREGTGRGGATIPISEVVVDSDRNMIEIYPENPIPGNRNFMVVISSVRNPNNFGVHNFNLDAMFQGDSFRRFVGVWPLDVAAQ